MCASKSDPFSISPHTSRALLPRWITYRFGYRPTVTNQCYLSYVTSQQPYTMIFIRMHRHFLVHSLRLTDCKEKYTTYRLSEVLLLCFICFISLIVFSLVCFYENKLLFSLWVESHTDSDIALQLRINVI
jgi:hypothetical protein